MAAACMTCCLAWGVGSARAGEADTTRMYRIGEVVVTGSHRATGRSSLPYSVSVLESGQWAASGSQQLLSAISGLVPSLFVAERNVMGFGVGTGAAGGIRIRGVGGSPTSGVLMMVACPISTMPCSP